MTRASAARGTVRLRSGDKLRSHDQEEYDVSTNGGREKDSVIEITRASSRKSSLEKSEATSTTTLENLANNEILGTILQLRSLLPQKQQSSSSSYCNDENETDEMKLYNTLPLKEFCLEANESVEKITKFLKSGDTSDLKGMTSF